jgi:hypothetical protein
MKSLRSRTLILLVLALWVRPMVAQEGGLSTVNAYIAAAAVTDPAYRTDLRPGGDSGSLASGRMMARSPLLGTFTYRAKTYADLNATERFRLLRSPGWGRYLKSHTRRRVVITPEQMLSDQPILLRLPSP